MKSLAAACGFLGAWSVVAGSMYQAILELQAADNASDRIRELVTMLPAPPRVSVWWWLVPPVGFVLHRRRRRLHRSIVIEAMSDEEFESQVRFTLKAMGWFLVGGGALLLGVSQTEALVNQKQWSDVVFWVLIVVMPMVAIGFAAGSVKLSERELDRHRAGHEAD